MHKEHSHPQARRVISIPNVGEFKPPPHVTRVSYGWQFRLRGATNHSEHFSDSKFGGVQGSFDAVCRAAGRGLNHEPEQFELAEQPKRKRPEKVVRWTRVHNHPDDVTECDLMARKTYEFLKINPSAFTWAMTQAQDQLVLEGNLAPDRTRDPNTFCRSMQKTIVSLIDELREKEAAQPPEPVEEVKITETITEPEQPAVDTWGDEEVPPPPLTLTQRLGSALAEVLRHPDLPQTLGIMLATAFRSETVQEAIGEVLQGALAHAMPQPAKAAPAKPEPAQPAPPKPEPEPATAMEAAMQKAGNNKFEQALQKPVEAKPVREGPKLRVLVAGLNPRQVNEFQREFNSALDLHFYYEGDSKDQLRLHARHCDWAFSTFTKSGSSVDMILRSNIALDKSHNHKPMRDRYLRAPASPHAVREKLVLLANGGMQR